MRMGMGMGMVTQPKDCSSCLCLCTKTVITHSKPHPEVFLKAAEMIHLDPSVCLVVEDAKAGVEAAVAGGFDCAAMGDAKDDPRATWHLVGFADLMQAVKA